MELNFHQQQQHQKKPESDKVRKQKKNLLKISIYFGENQKKRGELRNLFFFFCPVVLSFHFFHHCLTTEMISYLLSQLLRISYGSCKRYVWNWSKHFHINEYTVFLAFVGKFGGISFPTKLPPIFNCYIFFFQFIKC